jgi:hypothetical protein
VARQAVAPPPRPAPDAGPVPRSPRPSSGRPAVTSPVRRVAPPTSQIPSPTRPVARAAKAAAAPVERVAKAAAAPVERVAKAAAPVERVAGIVSLVTAPVERVAGVRRCGPVDDRGNLARRCATLPHRGSEHGAGSLEGARFLAPVVG